MEKNLIQSTLTGQDTEHLCTGFYIEKFGVPVHADLVDPFIKLQRKAREQGFNLQIISGFRSFEEQLSIWNRKVSGQLAVLDSHAVPLDINTLTEKELCFAILRWSALPGASRHHWGTDIDIYDSNAKPEDYEIELIPEEVISSGMFGPLHDWLDKMILEKKAFGFFRPYDKYRNGVSPERWHLSYSPVSIPFLKQLSIDALREIIEDADIKLKATLLENLVDIYQRFVTNIGESE